MLLITLKCPACAASISVDNNSSYFKCEYCQNQISIIKPITVNTDVKELDTNEQKMFSNYVTILEQSMKAGNYIEAYNYCNKGLELNPKSGSLWENKAICSFWLSSIDNLSNDKAAEIITYLNASRQNDPNSNTYNSVCEMIAYNLSIIANYKYKSIKMDVNVNGKWSYSNVQLTQIVNCMNIYELCYQIFPNINFLKKVVNELIGGKIKWLLPFKNKLNNSYIANSIGFDAKRKFEILVNKIQKVDRTYVPPEFPKTDYTTLIIVICVIGFFILLGVISKLLK